MSVTITRESPLQDDVRQFVADLNAHLKPLSPPQFQFQMTAEQMAGPDTQVFVARDETGKAVGMGALKQLDKTTGELKRMYTVPDSGSVKSKGRVPTRRRASTQTYSAGERSRPRAWTVWASSGSSS